MSTVGKLFKNKFLKEQLIILVYCKCCPTKHSNVEQD